MKQVISANRVLANLRGLAAQIPNQDMLISSIALQEARLSSEIENIVTTNDELYRADADPEGKSDPHTKEVLCHREALYHGFQALKARPLTTNLFIEIARLIKQTELGIRAIPGTTLARLCIRRRSERPSSATSWAISNSLSMPRTASTRW